MNKKTIFLDMDDTIADFTGHPVFEGQMPPDAKHMHEEGFFLSLKPIPGALVAVRALSWMGYDVHILSKPVAISSHSYSEKVKWIGMWFPELINKINFSQNKGHFKGDYLIDDNMAEWKDKFEANGGEFIHFVYHAGNHEAQWKNIEAYLRNKLGGSSDTRS